MAPTTIKVRYMLLRIFVVDFTHFPLTDHAAISGFTMCILIILWFFRSENPDWGIHQVEALLDRKDINSNVFTVITLFGEHTLHHMFPTLDHAVLKYLHPIFLDLCEKFQANYRMSNQFNMVIGHIKEVMRTDFNELGKNRKFELK